MKEKALIEWSPRTLGEQMLPTPKDPKIGFILPSMETRAWTFKATLILMVFENLLKDFQMKTLIHI